MNNKFENAEMMLDLIQSGIDLYNKDTGDFVFLYSSNGAIAVYKFDLDKAHELSIQTNKMGVRFWGSLLGLGGYIHENGGELEWCKEHYNESGWERTSQLDKKWANELRNKEGGND